MEAINTTTTNHLYMAISSNFDKGKQRAIRCSISRLCCVFFGVAIHPPFDFKTIIDRLRVAVVREKKTTHQMWVLCNVITVVKVIGGRIGEADSPVIHNLLAWLEFGVDDWPLRLG